VRCLKNPICHAPADVRLSTVIMPKQLEKDGVSLDTMDGVSMAVDWVRVYRKKQDLHPPKLPPLEVYNVPQIVERPRQVADAAKKAELFREDFESVALGALPASWEIGSGKPAVVADTASGAKKTLAPKNKVLKLNPDAYVFRMFDTPVKDRLEVEFDYYTPVQQPGLLFVTLGNFDKSVPDKRKLSYCTGDIGAYVHWMQTFLCFYAEPDKWTRFARWKQAVWNHARFVLDVGKGAFDYYAGPAATDFKGGGIFRHRQKAAHGIGLRHHGVVGSVYVDNIVVRVGLP